MNIEGVRSLLKVWDNGKIGRVSFKIKLMSLMDEEELADVIKSGEHKCKFYVNANRTGYSRCECGKKHTTPAS